MNKWIIAGLFYSLFIYLSALIIVNVTNPFSPTDLFSISYGLIINFDKWCINLLISIVVAYLLWNFNIWGAGDAKLFICFSALVPISQYPKVYFNNYFASFFLLIFIFLPHITAMFITSLIYSIRQGNLKRMFFPLRKINKKSLFEINKVFSGFLVIFLFSDALQFQFMKILNSGFNQFLFISISLLAFKYLVDFFKKNYHLSFISLLLLLFYFKIFHSNIFFPIILRSLINTSIAITVFPFVINIIDSYFKDSKKETVSYATWMFLGALLVWIYPG